jgi:hypothetical protein
MPKQQSLFSRDAPHLSTPILPILNIVVIALIAALVLYAALAIANYTIGGPLLRDNMRTLEYPLPASFNLALAIIGLGIGIRKMHVEQSAWFVQPPIFLGLGFIGSTLGTLIILEGLGNDLFSPLVGLPLAGLCLIFSLTILFYAAVLVRRARSHPSLKEAREE